MDPSGLPAHLLPNELLHLIIVLCRPDLCIPSVCRQVAQLTQSSAYLASSIAWRNAFLLGVFGGNPSESQPSSLTCPRLAQSLKRLLPAHATWAVCATAMAPSDPPPFHGSFFSPDYVDYLLSAAGPLIQGWPPIEDASDLGLILDTAWDANAAHGAQTAFGWWGGAAQAFLLAVYFVRSGQLGLLDRLLGWLVARSPGLETAVIRFARWSNCFLDNRPELSSFFANLPHNAPRLTFFDYLSVLALLEWSLPTIEIIMKHSPSTSPSLVADLADFHDQGDQYIADRMYWFIPYCCDSGRILSLLDWFNHVDEQLTPCDRFPMTTALACRSVFVDLLERVDVPACGGDIDRRELCLEAMCYAALNPTDLEMVLQLMDKHSLMSLDGWGHLLVDAISQPARCARFIEVLDNTFADKAGEYRAAYLQAIHQQLNRQSHDLHVLSKLYERFNGLDGYLIDSLVPNIALWETSDIPKLMSTTIFDIPWSHPNTLDALLTWIVDPSTFDSYPKTGSRCVSPPWLKTLCALVRAVFGACLGRLTKGAATPAWLLDMPRNKIAVLIACHLLHIAHRTQVPKAKSLKLAKVDYALESLLQAWSAVTEDEWSRRVGDDHLDKGARDPAQSLLWFRGFTWIPSQLVLSLARMVQTIRTRFDRVSLRTQSVYGQLIRALVRFDQDWVLVMTCAPAPRLSAAAHWEPMPMVFRQYFGPEHTSLLKSAVDIMHTFMRTDAFKVPVGKIIAEANQASAPRFSNVNLPLESFVRDTRARALAFEWLRTSALLESSLTIQALQEPDSA